MATKPSLNTDVWHREPENQIGTRAHSRVKTKNKSIIRGIAYHNRVYRALREIFKLPDHSLHIEPWLRNQRTRALCQPDALLVDPMTHTGIVIEVKMNWKDGRDIKLIDLYLHAAQSAFGLVEVWPALITSNIQGYLGQPRLGLSTIPSCEDWQPGDITPLVLHP